MSDVQREDVTATERERPYGRVALRCAEPPDLAATGRPVVGMCTTHDQGCCAGCPTLGCRFCTCRRDKGACSHIPIRDREMPCPAPRWWFYALLGLAAPLGQLVGWLVERTLR